MKLYQILAAAFVITSLAMPAMGAGFPEKPVNLMVPNSVGGMADVATRIVADGLIKELGQPAVVQNKPGAGGVVCLKFVSKSAPDGYTVFSGNTTQPIAISILTGKEPVEIGDYEVVGGFLPNERALYIQPDAPYSTWEEFIDYAKKHPEEVRIGFGGNQWSLELLRYVTKKAGINCKLVNYKSGGEASADFFGRHIDIAELGVGTAVYQAAVEGKAKVLAVTSGGKIPAFPDTPRLMDKGYPYPVLTEFGMLLPKGTPQPFVERLETALKNVLASPETMEKFAKLGAQARFSSGKELKSRCDEVTSGVKVMLEELKK